jgi:hypothetical protein
MSECYKHAGPGHVYRGRCNGRGHRQRSKVLKSLKGLASLGLIDAVLREDARRREAWAQVVEREQVGNLSPFQA